MKESRVIGHKLRLTQVFISIFLLALGLSAFHIYSLTVRFENNLNASLSLEGALLEFRASVLDARAPLTKASLTNVRDDLSALNRTLSSAEQELLIDEEVVLAKIGNLQYLLKNLNTLEGMPASSSVFSEISSIKDSISDDLDSLAGIFHVSQKNLQHQYIVDVGTELLVLMGLLGLACALCLYGLSFINRRILKPVRRLGEYSEIRSLGSIEPFDFDLEDDEIGHVITKVRSLHRILHEKNKELEVIGNMKSNFIAEISHEIRTPLNSIVGLAEVALSGSNSEIKPMPALHQIKDSSLHLVGLVNDVLDYQKLARGELQLHPKEITTKSLAEIIDSTFGVSALQKGLDLKITVHQSMPKLFMADATRIRQILFNLIGNAIKFTRFGSVSVDFKKIGRCIQFIVTDTGPGMADTELYRVFESFYQGSLGNKFGRGGTGLGLSLSRNLAQLMGGDIRVESEIDRGSSFLFSVPFQAVPESTNVSTEKLLLSKPAADERQLRLLVVDDHPLNLKVNVILLRNCGFWVDAVETGAGAISKVLGAWETGTAYDAVLMDIHLEDMSGIEATRQLRQKMKVGACPKVLALTAGVMPEELSQIEEVGIRSVIPKPFDVVKAKQAILKEVASTTL